MKLQHIAILLAAGIGAGCSTSPAPQSGETADLVLYNGKILTIRSEDLRSLAVIYDMTAEDLTDQLMGWGVLPMGTELD